MRRLRLLVLGVLTPSLVLLFLLSQAAASPGDTVADRVFGQAGSFTSNTANLGGISASSLLAPGGAFDAAGNLYVADSQNSRVLEYNSPLTTDLVADRVFGQPDFTTGTPNTGGISASSLFYPGAVMVDAAGNLYVDDWLNSRILEYDTPLSTDTVADRVFGQPNFTTVNVGVISASSLLAPGGMAVDAAGNLYVGDWNRCRVLEYNTPLTTDTVADRVFGQSGVFTTSICGAAANRLNGPWGVALDTAGNLYVADNANSRVLEYNTPLTTDTVADRVIGQPNFTSSACNSGGISASSLCANYAVAVDSAGDLYAADTNNNRVLEYDSPLTTDTVADRVFGQPGFTTNGVNTGGIGASSLDLPNSVMVDAAGNLYVADSLNNRVLVYESPMVSGMPTESPTPSPVATVCCASVTPLPTSPVGGLVDLATTGGGDGRSGTTALLVCLMFAFAVAGAAVVGFRRASMR